MLINVKVGTNLNRKSVLVEDTKTVKEILEQEEINYSTSTIYLDGCTLTPAQMNGTLADNGITESCFLIAAQKTENA